MHETDISIPPADAELGQCLCASARCVPLTVRQSAGPFEKEIFTLLHKASCMALWMGCTRLKRKQIKYCLKT
jgi:hypothetical protein